MKKNWRIGKILKTAWICGGLVFFAWMLTTFQSRNLPPETFKNSALVTVTETADLISFQSNSEKDFKLIFFQGGMPKLDYQNP